MTNRRSGGETADTCNETKEEGYGNLLLRKIPLPQVPVARGFSMFCAFLIRLFLFVSLFLLHDTSFRVLNETDDVLNLLTHRHLVGNLLQRILNAEVALINQAVGVDDMA